MPSSSRINVSVMAQVSRSRCQSVEFRARRETSRPRTIPALPILTSITSFWNPSRSTDDAPDWPKSLTVYGDDPVVLPTQSDGTLPKGILACCTLSVLDTRRTRVVRRRFQVEASLTDAGLIARCCSSGETRSPPMLGGAFTDNTRLRD